MLLAGCRQRSPGTECAGSRFPERPRPAVALGYPVTEAPRAGAAGKTDASAPAAPRGGCRSTRAWLGGATVRHNRRWAEQAQPDGLRSAPALGASAARNPSACSPERATKPGCARTPCRRPRAAFGIRQDHDADRFAKAKEGETIPAYFQSMQPHDLLKPHNAESPVTAQQPRHLHQILCANPLVENQVTGKYHPLGIGKQPAVNEPHHAQLFKSNRQGHQRPSDAA